MSTSAWSTQQLAEFVAAVSTAESESSAAIAAVERAAEALDADVAAIVCGGELVAAIGYPDGGAPVDELEAVKPGLARSSLEVPGVGRCAATAALLEHPPGATLVIGRPAPEGLTPEETGLLRGMARVASMTMRMLRVLDSERAARQEVEWLAREQAALRRVATLVAEAAPPDDIYAGVADEIAQRLGADVVEVLRYEADGTATIVGGWAVPGMHIPIRARLIVAGEGVAVSVLRTRRPAHVECFDGPPGSIAAQFHSLGVRSGVGSPIVVEDDLWGVAIAASTRPEALLAESEARIAEFTELVATAIANAEARAELRRIADEQAALRRVATLIARGCEPNLVFAAVAQEVGHVLPAADFTMVGRYDDADGAAEVVGGWSRAGDDLLVGRRTALGGRNVSTLVFERNQPARVDDFADDASALTAAAREMGMRSSVGAPISVEGRLWGVMIVASIHEDRLPAGTEHRLAEFTELVATAIANAEARDELRRVADEQAALGRVATLVAEAAPPSAVFAAVAGEVGRLLSVDRVFVGRYGADDTVAVVAAWSATGETMPAGCRGPVDRGSVSELVRETGRPAPVDRYADHLAEVVRELGIRSAVAAPITVEGRLWGLIAVASTGEPPPPGTEARLADFTGLVATAIANANAQAELTASRARIVASADETRRKIERDLHDGAQQRLVSLALQLRAAQAAVPPELDELAAELDRVAAGLTGALDELREFARGIHPAILAEGGLRPALRVLARRSPVPVDLDVRTEGRLPEPLEVAAYYVVSEALTNAAKHARAATVTVAVEPSDDMLRIGVRDDGVGGADFARGSGLVGLRDRVEALGGRIALQSNRGLGTSLSVELPLPHDASAVA
jgi:signal transduction histidine kinase